MEPVTLAVSKGCDNVAGLEQKKCKSLWMLLHWTAVLKQRNVHLGMLFHNLTSELHNIFHTSG